MTTIEIFQDAAEFLQTHGSPGRAADVMKAAAELEALTKEVARLADEGCQREHCMDQLRTQNRELHAALKLLYDETADYIRINHLGDAHHNQSMQKARDALAETEVKP